MSDYVRYAIFDVPEGDFFEAGSDWLGWNNARSHDVPHPVIDGLPGPAADITSTPRKYGFHGTMKPPFRLTEGARREDLETAMAAFCAVRPAVEVPELVLRRIGGFVAFVPQDPVPALNELAAAAVAGLDPFRAPPSQSELERRRAPGLSQGQDRMLRYWGYPYVFDEFRFHLTLSGRLEAAAADALAVTLGHYFAPVTPKPYRIDSLVLLGETADGYFHQLQRYALSG